MSFPHYRMFMREATPMGLVLCPSDKLPKKYCWVLVIGKPTQPWHCSFEPDLKLKSVLHIAIFLSKDTEACDESLDTFKPNLSLTIVLKIDLDFRLEVHTISCLFDIIHCLFVMFNMILPLLSSRIKLENIEKPPINRRNGNYRFGAKWEVWTHIRGSD